MKNQELNFRFHNPNSEKDTYNALLKIFTDVWCKKLVDIIAAQGDFNELTSPKNDKE